MKKINILCILSILSVLSSSTIYSSIASFIARRDALKTLELSGNPDTKTIKNAFRRLSMQHHPDMPTGSEKKFNVIQNASNLLLNKSADAFENSMTLKDAFNTFKPFGNILFDKDAYLKYINHAKNIADHTQKEEYLRRGRQAIEILNQNSKKFIFYTTLFTVGDLTYLTYHLWPRQNPNNPEKSNLALINENIKNHAFSIALSLSWLIGVKKTAIAGLTFLEGNKILSDHQFSLKQKALNDRSYFEKTSDYVSALAQSTKESTWDKQLFSYKHGGKVATIVSTTAIAGLSYFLYKKWTGPR